MLNMIVSLINNAIRTFRISNKECTSAHCEVSKINIIMNTEHPIVCPKNTIFIKKDDGWYFEDIKINPELPEKLRIIIAATDIYFWERAMYSIMADENKANSYHAISMHLLAWQRWIEGDETWKRYCCRIAPSTESKMIRKATSTTKPPPPKKT